MTQKTDLEKALNNSQCKDEKEVIKHKIEIIVADIIELEASKNAKVVKEQVTSLDLFGGKLNHISMWKIKRKLFPRCQEPPTAKKDQFGNIITAPEALKTLYLNTYINRLEHRKIHERFESIRLLKSELWKLRLESLKKKPSKEWTMKDLEKATKSLKTINLEILTA